MAVPFWYIIDKTANALVGFEGPPGGSNYVPYMTVYLGGATWYSVAPDGTTAQVHLSVQTSGALALHDVITGTLSLNPLQTVRGITFDGKARWYLVEGGGTPPAYSLYRGSGHFYNTAIPSGVYAKGLCMDGWGFEEPLEGRCFYTVGDDDQVYQLYVDGTTAQVAATYSIVMGSRETVTDIEWAGNGWFWTMHSATDRFGTPIPGGLVLLKNWMRVKTYSIPIGWSGLSTDGMRLMIRAD